MNGFIWLQSRALIFKLACKPTQNFRKSTEKIHKKLFGETQMTNLFAVEEADFQSKVLASDVPVLVDFWATWCGPCRAIAPILEEIAQEFAGKLNIAKVNVDENSDLAAQYGIRSIPALLLFKNGKIADTVIGMQPKPRLVEFVKQHI